MTKLLKRPPKNQNGFTLVELIVVLVILGVLAAILVPTMISWIEKAKNQNLITACRACVMSAQTLAYEQYKTTTKENLVLPSFTEVLTLAGINQGSVEEIELEEKLEKQANGTDKTVKQPIIKKLTYKDETGACVTYLKEPTPHYVFNQINNPKKDEWKSGSSYEVGDRMQHEGYIFECVIAIDSEKKAATVDPVQKINYSWRAVGYCDSILSYNRHIRYAEGIRVTYDDKVYERTAYDPKGGQTPNAESKHWTLVGN